MQTLLEKRKHRGLFRQLSLSKAAIDFASNDTLGLSRSSPLAQLAQKQLNQARAQTGLTGFCATGSRLFSGNFPYTMQLEEEIALYHNFPTATLFSCGYMANLGLLTAIGKDAVFFYDSKIHASTRDGISLSKSTAFPFRHNDLDHLEKRLKHAKGTLFVCIESIYSTDGSLAPLEEILLLTERFGAHLVVDETHAIGAHGPNGAGLVGKRNLQQRVFALVASLAKAFGCYGAICLGSPLLKDLLINFARSFIYSTALPLQNLAAIRAAYQLMPFLEKERSHLYELMETRPSHLFSIPIKGRVLECTAELANQGFAVAPLRSPTVGRKEEGLRISLHSTNTKAELIHLLSALHPWRKDV